MDAKSVVSGATVILATMLSLVYGALADSNLNCDAYVASATAQHKRNLDLGCGFTGARWSDNVWLHKNWCQSPNVRIEHITAEQVAREEALSQCLKNRAKVNQLQDAAKKSKCRNYADTAVKLSNQNQQYGCGFTDSRYSPNHQGHFDWCMTVPHTTANAEIAASQKSIDACIKQNAAFRYENPQPPYCKDGTCALDVCWESSGRICNNAAALNFCASKGHPKVVTYKTAQSGITNHGAGGSCSGNCTYFTRIVCKGTN